MISPLDYRQELNPTEQVFVEVLRSTPACVLDRASCRKGCIDRGMNPNTFALYTTYCPIVAHLGTDIWSLRGVHVDPAAVAAVRQANSLRPKERRLLDHGWSPQGRLWFARRLSAVAESAPQTIPSAIRHYVSGRDFKALNEKEHNVGTIRISDEGASWGYGPFLRQNGADEGDVLFVSFDLENEAAYLTLGDDDLLEEMSPTA